MKRTFADLHLRVTSKDPAQSAKIISKAAELGYKLVAMPLPIETPQEQILKLKTHCNNAGIDFATRIDLRPRHQNELLSQLRKLRRKYEIICVLCENKEVARQAAKDRRVDLLNFPNLDYRKRFFDRAEAELASCSIATLEMDLKPLLVLEGPPRVKLLASMRREISLALEFHLPMVISSGVSEPILLRKPQETALLASLAGLKNEVALDAVSTNPKNIVTRNREKLSSGFVAPGIRVVKQGEDC